MSEAPDNTEITAAMIADDQRLVAELQARMPGAAAMEIERVFMSMRLSYGEHAIEALRDGAVQIVLTEESQ